MIHKEEVEAYLGKPICREESFHPADEFYSNMKSLPASLQQKLTPEDLKTIFQVMVKPMIIKGVRS